ncbi:MAG: hypothetical protein KJ824_11500, partial [Alphaproteobacteria bacterium]|nr:hypothetical protein [Alphaproteobacteria bacterium]
SAAAAAPSARPSANRGRSYPVSLQSLNQIEHITSMGPEPKPPTERMANINYSVPVTRLKKLAKELGSINLNYREVGVKTFEYAYDDLVGDD